MPLNAYGVLKGRAISRRLGSGSDQIVQRAMADQEAPGLCFWRTMGTRANKADKYFGFVPGNGIHDIHMNQGNVGSFVRDDGVWQDGGVLFHFPREQQWTAIFLKFQSQSWHTDDVTGHTLSVPEAGEPVNPNPIAPQPTETLPDGLVRIVKTWLIRGNPQRGNGSTY